MSRQAVVADPAGACPELRQFLGAYFHQDWSVDAPRWEAVVDEFVTESPHSLVVATADELAALLGLGLTEPELDAVLTGLDAGVLPAAFGLSASAWLEAVLQRLRSDR